MSDETSDPGPPTSETPPVPHTSRTRLRWGGASDVGRLRQANEDSMLTGPHVFVVADGMGGHAAGEVASQITVDTIDAEVPADVPRRGGAAMATNEGTVALTRVHDMVHAVQAANDAVFARSADDPSLAGMGTTVVAVGVVFEDDEERIAIVNVGDSRAYSLSGGELRQVSDDHSLVGEMVREGSLTREEASHHPRKNIVTRAIGIDEYVEVDEFQILPHTGDRYLLCSDGLTDEVTDDDIATVLRTVDDPAAAAAELVERANANGGRDNITIVVVDVVDDGLDPAMSSSAGIVESVPDDVDFSEHPEHDTQTFAAVPDGAGDSSGRRPPRAITLRSLAFVVAVLVVIGAGGFLAYNYVRNTYYVGIADEEVVVFRGRPGGVLWFDPTVVDLTGIDVDDVPGGALDDLEAGVSTSTLSGALRYVANLEDRIDSLTPPVTTTTTSTTVPGASTTRPTTTTTTTRP